MQLLHVISGNKRDLMECSSRCTKPTGTMWDACNSLRLNMVEESLLLENRYQKCCAQKMAMVGKGKSARQQKPPN